MSLPVDLNTITVTASYPNIAGQPQSGSVTFDPGQAVADTAGQVILTGAVTRQVWNGRMQPVILPCTDNAGLNPTGFAYTVTEVIGVNKRSYQVMLPHTLGASVDLSSLSPASPPPAATAFASNNTWTGTQTFDGNPPLVIPAGAVNGYVLTSDANGDASWEPSTGGGGGLTNPMTGVGDTIYGGAAGVPTRLAAQTAAAKRFLTETGTGSAGQAPAWSAIVAGDVPTLNQNTTGTAGNVTATLDLVPAPAANVALAGHKITGLANGSASSDAATFGQVPVADSVAADFQPNGVVTAGSSGKWADAGHIHPYQPWQFLPESYGAKGDGKIVGDAAMTASAATLTSATANFTSADVNKNIVVNGALGSSNAPLYATVSSVTNSTTVTLSANATSTISGAAAFYASDDSAAIASTLNAASAYAQSNDWKAQVIFQAKAYGLATPTVTTASGSLAQQNALMPLPYPNVNGTTQKLMIELLGVGESAEEQYFDSTIPSMTGTALVATVAASGGSPSVVGGPNSSTNLAGTWANTKVTIKGITVWCGWNTGFTAYDLRNCAAVWVESAGAQVLASNVAGHAPLMTQVPTNTNGCGFNFPANNDSGAGRIIAEGYYTGVIVSPRTTIDKLMTFDNNTGIFLKTVTGTVTHGAWIGYWSCNSCTTAIVSTGTAGTFMSLVIGHYDGSGSVTNFLSDPNGTIQGSVNWWNASFSAPVVASGFALRIVNMRQPAGPVASPTSPSATGVAWQNTYWRDAAVTVSVAGGTMTALSIDSVDQHIPASCVLWQFTVPSGHSYTPTYTGTLAHDVTLG